MFKEIKKNKESLLNISIMILAAVQISSVFIFRNIIPIINPLVVSLYFYLNKNYMKEFINIVFAYLSIILLLFYDFFNIDVMTYDKWIEIVLISFIICCISPVVISIEKIKKRSKDGKN